MALLWVRDDEDGWAIVRLDGEPVALTADRARPVRRRTGSDAGPERAVLVREPDPRQETWVLLAPAGAGVRVNGRPLPLGLRVLRHRDAIQPAGGDYHFFSTERPVQVEVFAGGDGPTMCPRCRQEISPAATAVRCPQCGVVHHQSEELPCWTGYDDGPFETCAMCDYPVSADTEFRWTPEGL